MVMNEPPVHRPPVQNPLVEISDRAKLVTHTPGQYPVTILAQSHGLRRVQDHIWHEVQMTDGSRVSIDMPAEKALFLRDALTRMLGQMDV